MLYPSRPVRLVGGSIAFCLLLVVAVGCIGSPDRLPPCDSWDSAASVCGVRNPEDLGFLSSPDWVVASEMAWVEPNAGPEVVPVRVGRLTAIRVRDGERQKLFPREWVTGDVAEPGWGEASCTQAPDATRFQPHGLDVGRGGPAGELALAVVNHGGRQAVELFEIDLEGEPSLDWRGCVPMPEDVMANDVAFLPDGGFVVTNFMSAEESQPGLGAILGLSDVDAGAETGFVLRWRRGKGLAEIPNSRGSAPNGVIASADGKSIYVAEWGAGRVFRLRLDGAGDGEAENGTGAPVREAVSVTGSPDNLTWTRDGRILVASQDGGLREALACSTVRKGGCDVGYSVFLIDPQSLEKTLLLRGRGAASVALEVGGEVFIGFFAGDQISRVPWPD